MRTMPKQQTLVLFTVFFLWPVAASLYFKDRCLLAHKGILWKLPQVKEYIDNSIRIAKEKGYVETIYGRRRFLPIYILPTPLSEEWQSVMLLNAPIQGSAADIIKLAMVNIQKKAKKFLSKPGWYYQVHDELIFDVANEELEKVKGTGEIWNGNRQWH